MVFIADLLSLVDPRYVVIMHKYYLFSFPKHCIHKLLDARNKAAKNSSYVRLKNTCTPTWAC
jgi:hypothetical protein